MKKTALILLFIFSYFCGKADGRHHRNDTLYIYHKIDTTYIQDFHDMLNVKAVAVKRFNKFSITDNISQNKLEYEINNSLNMGLDFSFKSIGFGIEYNPPGINKDDNIYGKTTQFALSTGGNTRRFIYDAYYRYNEGFHTSSAYKIPNDSAGRSAYIYRHDIVNYNAGFNLLYIFNNKRFSSSAPYSFTQRQIKSAGSLLVGTYALLYGITADSVIFPDSLKKYFKPEVQFKNASSYTWGVSCGYTYTFIFGKYWYVNIATVPGISVQEFYSVNAYDQSSHSKVALGLALQSRFSIGFNKQLNFLGICYSSNNYWINNDAKSALNYQFSSIRIYYGHRFDLRKVLKKHF
ncbi:MAG: DUF4421 family protein [Bacteroidia bacterium]